MPYGLNQGASTMFLENMSASQDARNAERNPDGHDGVRTRDLCRVKAWQPARTWCWFLEHPCSEPLSRLHPFPPFRAVLRGLTDPRRTRQRSLHEQPLTPWIVQ